MRVPTSYWVVPWLLVPLGCARPGRNVRDGRAPATPGRTLPAQASTSAAVAPAQSSRPETTSHVTEPPRATTRPPSAAARNLQLDAPPRCPPEMALVREKVCVDRWEATLVTASGDGERPWSPYRTPSGAARSSRAASKPGVVPQGYISGEQAARACRHAGKRLCKSAEWLAACRGPNDTTYPYGPRPIAKRCSDDGRRTHPVAEAAGRAGLAAERMWYEGMDLAMINQLPNTLLKTGERRGCTNEYGVYDMVGNLHEWIDDPEGTFRGGFYLDTRTNGEGCEYTTTAHSMRYHDYSTGFRCCLDADAVE